MHKGRRATLSSHEQYGTCGAALSCAYHLLARLSLTITSAPFACALVQARKSQLPSQRNWLSREAGKKCYFSLFCAWVLYCFSPTLRLKQLCIRKRKIRTLLLSTVRVWALRHLQVVLTVRFCLGDPQLLVGNKSLNWVEMTHQVHKGKANR